MKPILTILARHPIRYRLILTQRLILDGSRQIFAISLTDRLQLLITVLPCRCKPRAT